MENLCEMVARQVIDVPEKRAVPGVSSWSSADPAAAIADFTQTLLGLTPSDPRSGPIVSALNAHFAAARDAKVSASIALQSTFVVACLSPSSLAIGM
jgi:hypothetical protein